MTGCGVFVTGVRLMCEKSADFHHCSCFRCTLVVNGAPTSRITADKAHGGRPPLPHEQSPAAYVANVVGSAELFHFVQAHGRGQKVVAWLAAQQLSVVTFGQLQAAGLSRGVIVNRLADGSLHRRHRGVYLVGSPVPLPGAKELAALLACGGDAVISHRSAAALWGIAAAENQVHVTVVGRHCRSRSGIEVIQVKQLDRRDRRVRNGIAVTAPARTMIDFAADADDDELERAVSEARALQLVHDGEIDAALARAGNRRGVARMRAFLRRETESGYTRSGAERMMRRLLRAGRLPPALCNAPVAGYRADFLWPDQRLIVEVDSFQFHGHRRAFERDRRKDQVLLAAGYRVLRVTWLQLRDEPIAVAVAIAAALTASRAAG